MRRIVKSFFPVFVPLVLACNGHLGDASEGGAGGDVATASSSSGFGGYYDPPPCGSNGCSRTPVEISVGPTHACALMMDGTVRCWGWGTTGDWLGGSSLDEPVPNLSDAIEVKAGEEHSCAIERGGEVVCWGKEFPTASTSMRNLAPTNGDCPTVSSPIPKRALAGPARAGYLSIFRRTNCVILADDNLDAQCWGASNFGAASWFAGPQIENAAFAEIELSPLAFALLRIDGTASVCNGGCGTCNDVVETDVQQIATQTDSTYFVKRDGSVTSTKWDGGCDTPPVEQPLPALHDVLEVRVAEDGYKSDDCKGAGAAAGPAVCVRTSNGHIACWGAKALVGANAPSDPVEAPTEIAGIDDAVQLSVGARTACVLTAKNQIRCFGSPSDGAWLDPTVPVVFGGT